MHDINHDLPYIHIYDYSIFYLPSSNARSTHPSHCACVRLCVMCTLDRSVLAPIPKILALNRFRLSKNEYILGGMMRVLNAKNSAKKKLIEKISNMGWKQIKKYKKNECLKCETIFAIVIDEIVFFLHLYSTIDGDSFATWVFIISTPNVPNHSESDWNVLRVCGVCGVYIEHISISIVRLNKAVLRFISIDTILSSSSFMCHPPEITKLRWTTHYMQYTYCACREFSASADWPPTHDHQHYYYYYWMPPNWIYKSVYWCALCGMHSYVAEQQQQKITDQFSINWSLEIKTVKVMHFCPSILRRCLYTTHQHIHIVSHARLSAVIAPQTQSIQSEAATNQFIMHAHIHQCLTCIRVRCIFA